MVNSTYNIISILKLFQYDIMSQKEYTFTDEELAKLVESGAFTPDVPLCASTADVPLCASTADASTADASTCFSPEDKIPDECNPNSPKFIGYHVSNKIKTINDCVLPDAPSYGTSPKFNSFMQIIFGCNWSTISESSKLIGVRGNGYCGINSIFVYIMKIYPEKANGLDYQSSINLLEQYLLNYGFNEINPNSIHDDIVCRAMRDFCRDIEIDRSTIIIINIDSHTIIANKLHADSNRENTFTIIYSNGHYSPFYVPEVQRIQIYESIKSLIEHSIYIETDEIISIDLSNS